MPKIDEKIFIELYRSGKSDLELAHLFNTSERSIQRYSAVLRLKHKLPERKTLFPNKEEYLPKFRTELESLNWDIKKSKLDNKGKSFKSYLVTADWHVPYVDVRSAKALFQLMDDIKFDGNIILGDYMDMESISHWLVNKRKTLENKRMMMDYIEGNKILDELDKRLPKNSDKRFFYGNHESVHKDSDILTETGWKKVTEVTKEDKLAQFDIKTGNITYAYPKKLHKHFSQYLIDVESFYSHQAVTMNHDVVIGKEKIKASALLEQKVNPEDLRLIGKRNQRNKVVISDSMLKILTWIIMDGTVIYYNKYNKNSKKVTVQFKISRPEKIRKLISLLNECQIDCTIQKASKSFFNILQPYYIRIYGENARNIVSYFESNKKEFPKEWKNLNRKQTEIILKTISDTDGSKSKDSNRIKWISTNKNDIDLISFLCVNNGFIFSEMQKCGHSGFGIGKKQYGLNFYLSDKDYICKNDKVKVNKIEYNDYAYCVTMPKGTIIIKSKGKVAFTGNCWYYDLLELYPALEGFLDPSKELKLEERGYQVYRSLNHIEKIGKLSFTHGIYTCANYVKKHIDELKTNVLFGHLHSEMTQSACSPAREEAIAGYCLGCMCNMNPAYQKNRPHKWTHGFAIVHFYDNGLFDVEMKRIVRGKFIYNGKVYNGNC